MNDRAMPLIFWCCAALLAGAPARSARNAGGDRHRHPAAATPDNGDQRRQAMLAIARQVAELIAADLRSTAELVPLGAGPEGLLFLSRSRPRRLSRMARSRRQGAAHRLRPGAPRRPADGRLLPPRRRARARARAARASSSAPATGAAPRTAAPTLPIRPVDRRAGLVRHPHRLCRRKRRSTSAGQAHRGDGQRRHQPPLSDRRARRWS